MDTLSIRKYATLKGCSEGNVRSAIKSGKINKGVKRDGNGKVLGIIIAVANKEWADNYNMDRIRNHSVLDRLMDRERQEKPIQPNDLEDEIEDDEFEKTESANNEGLFNAKLKEAILKAELLELQLLEKKKQLIDASKVYKALFDFSAQAGLAILSIPDRIIDDLIASSSRSEAYNLLYSSLNEALASLSNSKPKGL